MSLSQRLSDIMKEQNITEAALGKKAGISQQAINKIVKGETQKPRNLIAIASALNVDPIWLVSGIEPRQNISYPSQQILSKNLSIYTLSHSLHSHIFHLDKNKIARKLISPPSLNQRQGLYGFYMQGSMMIPRFKAGDLIIADSYQPPKEGEDCVVAYKSEKISSISILCFSQIKEKQIIAFQYNPKKEFIFNEDDVTLHRILQIEDFFTDKT